jgi:hypothetical protein
MAQRKQFPGALKAKVAVEAIRSEKTINEIAETVLSRPRSIYGVILNYHYTLSKPSKRESFLPPSRHSERTDCVVIRELVR